jgi:hypothetical protein
MQLALANRIRAAHRGKEAEDVEKAVVGGLLIPFLGTAAGAAGVFFLLR